MKRLPLILGFLASLLVSLGCTGGKDSEAVRPNIIFIMTDDQSSIVPDRFDSEFDFSDGNRRGVQSHPFGFNGDKQVYTPTIDQLAKNGMIFTRAYVSSSVCSPSRYTTLTGRYAGRCEGARSVRRHDDRLVYGWRLLQYLPEQRGEKYG